MAFMTSGDMFDSVFGKELEKEPTALYLDELSIYLKNKHSPLAQAMGEYISMGRELSAFTCREDVFQDVAEELYERNIPYAATATKTGDRGFLVRAEDMAAANEATYAVRGKRSRTCLVLSGKEMLRQAAKEKEKNRSCIAIYGLSTGQAQMMKEGFAKHVEAAKIGLDKMKDGTVTLTVFAPGSIKKNIRQGADLCTIFLEMILSSGGPDGVSKQACSELKATMQSRLAKNFQDGKTNLNKNPLWIVGSGTQYICVTAGAFTYGRAVVDERNVLFNQEFQADAIQPDYRQMLVSYAQRIPFPMLTNNREEVIEHFLLQKEDGDAFDILDTAPDAKNRVWSRGEKQMATLMDRMITRKIQNDSIMIMDGRENEKFEHFKQELIVFLEHLRLGHIPDGYEPSEGKALFEIMKKHKLEGEMFGQAILFMQTIDAVLITTTIERLADIGAIIDREKELEKEERAEKARARMASHGAPKRRGFAAGSRTGSDMEKE